jgi:hypothetical protein
VTVATQAPLPPSCCPAGQLGVFSPLDPPQATRAKEPRTSMVCAARIIFQFSRQSLAAGNALGTPDSITRRHSIAAPISHNAGL